MATRIMLKNVRLSYAHIFKPRKNDRGEDRYSAALLIPKDHPQIDEIRNAIQTEGEAKFGKKWAAMFKKKDPLKDADADGMADDNPPYEGMFYINANSDRQPQVVDRQVRRITDESEAYSGMWANVSIAVYGFEVPDGTNKGVTFGLNNIQKVRDDERLGGAPNADDEFEALDDDDEDDGFDMS